MSDAVGRPPRVPPPWFVHTAWRAHRALYRLSGGRFLWTTSNERGWGALLLTTTGRRSGQEQRHRRLHRRRSSPRRAHDERLGRGPSRLVAQPRGAPRCRRSIGAPAPAPGARPPAGEEHDRLWQRWVAVDPKLDAYAVRRSTETPVVVFEARRRDGVTPGVGVSDTRWRLRLRGEEPGSAMTRRPKEQQPCHSPASNLLRLARRLWHRRGPEPRRTVRSRRRRLHEWMFATRWWHERSASPAAPAASTTPSCGSSLRGSAPRSWAPGSSARPDGTRTRSGRAGGVPTRRSTRRRSSSPITRARRSRWRAARRSTSSTPRRPRRSRRPARLPAARTYASAGVPP